MTRRGERTKIAASVAVLGYFEVIEGYHPRTSGIERLVARTGLKREAFSQLFEHAHADVEHRKDLEALIDSMPLEPRHETLMGINAVQTVGLLSERCSRSSQRQRRPTRQKPQTRRSPPRRPASKPH